MIHFEFKYHVNYENQPEAFVIYQTNAVTLDEIFEGFESFLKGCGFEFDGQIDIVNEENNDEKKVPF